MAWAPDYVTLSKLKNFVRVNDTADDEELALDVTAASRAVDRFCGRQFGLAGSAVERYYTARYDRERRRWFVPIDDLMDSTGLVVTIDPDGSATTTTAYRLLPRNAAADDRPWTELHILPSSPVTPDGTEGGVKIAANWGWSAVPAAVEKATLLQASRLSVRRDAPLGVAGSPEVGSEIRLLAKLDPDVQMLLYGYRKWVAA